MPKAEARECFGEQPAVVEFTVPGKYDPDLNYTHLLLKAAAKYAKDNEFSEVTLHTNFDDEAGWYLSAVFLR